MSPAFVLRGLGLSGAPSTHFHATQRTACNKRPSHNATPPPTRRRHHSHPPLLQTHPPTTTAANTRQHSLPPPPPPPPTPPCVSTIPRPPSAPHNGAQINALRAQPDAQPTQNTPDTKVRHSCRAPFLSHHAQAYCDLGMVSHTTHHATSRQRGHTSRQHTRCVCTRVARWAGIRLTYGRFHHLPNLGVLHHGHTVPSRAHCFHPPIIRVWLVLCVCRVRFFSLAHLPLPQPRPPPRHHDVAPIDARRAQHAAQSTAQRHVTRK
jgi:hypothetical protein